MVLLSLGFFVMVWATMLQGGDVSVKVSMLFLVFAYLFHTLGELCLSPIGLSMVSKLAPLKFTSLLMGAWFLCTAIANKLAGVVGQFIGKGEEQVDNALTIFMSVGIAGLITALIVFLSANKLVAWMHGAEGEPSHDIEEKLEEEFSITATYEGVNKEHN